MYDVGLEMSPQSDRKFFELGPVEPRVDDQAPGVANRPGHGRPQQIEIGQHALLKRKVDYIDIVPKPATEFAGLFRRHNTLGIHGGTARSLRRQSDA